MQAKLRPKLTYPPLLDSEERFLGPAQAPRLNLGCGRDVRQGWLNVDLHSPYADQRVDLQRFPWPWPDDHFRTILAHQYLEHVPHQLQGHDGLLRTLQEVQRVLAPGGRFLATVPYPGSDVDLGNPTHYRRLSPHHFYFLGEDDTSTLRAAYAFDTLRLAGVRVLRSARLGRWFDTSYHPNKWLGRHWNLGRRRGIAFLFTKRQPTNLVPPVVPASPKIPLHNQESRC